MIRRTVIVVGVMATLACAILFGNYWGAERQLSAVIHSDPRNEGVVAYAHYDYFVNESTLVFDLTNIDAKNSKLDVFRVFLQFAESQRNNDFALVKLSFRGVPKFLIKGTYFKMLGLEYKQQNSVYTIRTFPENLYTVDGKQAFGSWTGGLLGVLGKQMEDFSEFHQQWYLREMVAAHG